ncbi:MAG: AgmX/PglI C-terminal domain-containing protein [Myxococcota bacterium]|nr:AgmX/PglI C-terminal domain-containing protein [Myxococcota bacterium]
MGSILGSRGKNWLLVTTGKTKASGCLKSEVVQRVLKSITNQAKYCYEKEFPRNPGLSEKIITTFVIDGAGKVQVVEIEDSTIVNSQSETCLQRVIQRLRFAPFRGGRIADVTYPWIFKSSSL